MADIIPSEADMRRAEVLMTVIDKTQDLMQYRCIKLQSLIYRFTSWVLEHIPDKWITYDKLSISLPEPVAEDISTDSDNGMECDPRSSSDGVANSAQ